MKIVLVCISAITTNILANKLNLHAKEKGYDDSFMAIKISLFSNVIDNTDLFLIAPQAKYEAEELKKECLEREIPFIELAEEEFVLKDIESIYKKINQNRKISKATENEKITIETYLKTFRDAAICTLLIFALSLPCLFLYRLSGFEPFKIIYDLSGGIIGFYFLLYVGYGFGNNSKGNPICSVFLMLACSLIMIPAISFGEEFDYYFHTTKGLMYLEYFSPSHLWISVVCSITVLLLNGLWRGILNRLHIMINEYSLFSGLYLNLFPIGISLLLRYLVSIFL